MGKIEEFEIQLVNIYVEGLTAGIFGGTWRESVGLGIDTWLWKIRDTFLGHVSRKKWTMMFLGFCLD